MRPMSLSGQGLQPPPTKGIDKAKSVARISAMLLGVSDADCQVDWFGVALNKGFHLLKQFSQEVYLPSWLAPLSMVGVLAVLIKLLLAIEKGSLLAGLGGYLLLGILIVNVIALSILVCLPGKLVTFKSVSASRVRLTLLRLLLMGFLVTLKNLFQVVLHLVFDVVVLILTALTYPSRQDEQLLNMQCS
ncbi:hypothetical protein [Acaryochloris sp. IP29b_bin.137]|uniref:hypothetical protein n=1 Tax=Acaryochloris sp. IP29b_bin.137 TaxID=2969217 RepID=UPI002621BEE0|nr:hypothetical protein [Acaryochloris sp. IP29b_bin.137]